MDLAQVNTKPGIFLDANDCVIENVDIVTPFGTLKASSLCIRQGRIFSVRSCLPKRRLPGRRSPSEDCRKIDGRGMMLLPGIIDLHSDALENAIEPRPGSLFPLNIALTEFDKILVGCGITTMFHCVAFMISDDRQRSLRTNEKALSIIHEINRLASHMRV